MGEFWIAENFGDICPCDKKCGSGCGEFAYGGLAHQYGWPHAPITKWKAGSIEGVAWWQTLGRHGGGSNEGTFPPRSTWAVVPFSYKTVAADPGTYGHVIDKVKVPESLEPGDDVLSWRLDRKCSAQVFNSCANIEITK